MKIPGKIDRGFFSSYIWHMPGIFLILMLTILGGAICITFSVLAWRLKKTIFFILGIISSACLLFLCLLRADYYLWSLLHPTQDFTGIFILLSLGLSLYFLVASKIKQHHGDDDTTVSDLFLDEIINEKDDDIDYS